LNACLAANWAARREPNHVIETFHLIIEWSGAARSPAFGFQTNDSTTNLVRKHGTFMTQGNAHDH
jgi:hypothetical protein